MTDSVNHPSQPTLLQYCEADDVFHVTELIDPLLQALHTDAQKDMLLVKLFVDDYEHDSPLEATIRAAGASGAGHTQLRLYMLECLSACGPHTRFAGMEDHEAFIPRLATSMHEQYLRFMPRLGALARPYVTYTADGQEEIDRATMQIWLEEFIALPHDSIGLCVANGFYEEYNEIRDVLVEFGGIDPDNQVAQRDRLSPDFPNDIDRGNLGCTFSTAIQMAKDAFMVGDHLQSSMRLHDAQRYRELSRRLQAAVATALDSMGDDVSYLMLRHKRGQAAMALATLEGMRFFLSAPAVRGAVRRLWLGENLFQLFDKPSLSGAMSHLGWSLANLAALPLVAATPMISHRRSSHWGWVRVFRHRDNYLLQVACFQAFVYQGLDLLLTMYLTFGLGTYSLLGFFWACSSLWFEAVQIMRSIRVQSVSERIGALSAYLVQDMFNAIDIPTLFLCAWAFHREWRHPTASHDAVRQLRSRGGSKILTSSDMFVEDVSFDVHSPHFTSVESFAVLFMWFRQLRPLGLISNAFGDLVQMLAAMLKDVMLFMVLFVVVLLGFAAAIAHLVTNDDVDAAAGECGEMMVRLNSVSSSVFLLFEGALLGDVNPIIECVRASSHAAVGVCLLFLFMLLSILMLLNMIIAIMGQTFSNFYESAQEEGALYFSRIVQDWEEHTGQPPLLNLLALPWALVVGMRRAAAALLTALGRDASWIETGWLLPGTAQESVSQSMAEASRTTERRLSSSYAMLNEFIEFPEGAPTLDEMKSAIGEVLERKFGACESTAELLDKAVVKLNRELQEVIRKLDEQGRKLGVDKKTRRGKLERDREKTRMRHRAAPTSSGGFLAGMATLAAAPLNVVVAAGSSVVDAAAQAADAAGRATATLGGAGAGATKGKQTSSSDTPSSSDNASYRA
jgi:hypothetical protein